MANEFPSAEEYAQQHAERAPLSVVNIDLEQRTAIGSYTNRVLLNVNQDCLRMSVFEGQYRWHHHPESDELFLVVQGELNIEFRGAPCVVLTEWQCLLVPAGTVHRTHAVGRTVTVTYERQSARTVFDE